MDIESSASFPLDSGIDRKYSESVARRINAPEVVAVPPKHLGLHWRELTLNDVVDVSRLYLQEAGAQLTGEKLSVDEFVSRLEVALSEPNRAATLGGWDADEVLHAVAMVEVNDDALTELQANIFAFVDQQWRGRGIGRSLLEWQDGMARQLLCRDGRDLPVAIRSQVNSGNLDRRRLLAAGGFSPVHRKTLLVRGIEPADVKLALAAQQRLQERGFTRVKYNDNYSEQLRRVHNRLTITIERGQPISHRNWAKFISRIDRRYSYLLLNGDDVVGYTICVDNDSEETLFVRHYGVERGIRNSGVGSDLILALLDARTVSAKNEIQVPIITEGAPQRTFLSKHGFLEGLSQILYTIDL